MRFVGIVLLFSTITAHSQSVYLTYSEWEKMPPVLREMYVAGAFDTLSTIAVPEQAGIAKHYNECVKKSELMPNQLAQNIIEFAKNQPDLQMKPAASVVARYLGSLCGLPGAH